MRPFHVTCSMSPSRCGCLRTSVEIATCPSSRARCAPRHEWKPPPNDMWSRASARRRSSSIGGCAPLLGIAVGRTETRHQDRTRLDRRTVDLVRRERDRGATSARASRSAATRRRRLRRPRRRVASNSSWWRLRNNASVPLPMRFTVVSWPAMYSSITCSTSSCGLRRSPSSSAAISALNRSSVGCVALPLDDLVRVSDDVVDRPRTRRATPHATESGRTSSRPHPTIRAAGSGHGPRACRASPR